MSYRVCWEILLSSERRSLAQPAQPFVHQSQGGFQGPGICFSFNSFQIQDSAESAVGDEGKYVGLQGFFLGLDQVEDAEAKWHKHQDYKKAGEQRREKMGNTMISWQIPLVLGVSWRWLGTEVLMDAVHAAPVSDERPRGLKPPTPSRKKIQLGHSLASSLSWLIWFQLHLTRLNPLIAIKKNHLPKWESWPLAENLLTCNPAMGWGFGFNSTISAYGTCSPWSLAADQLTYPRDMYRWQMWR